MEPFYLPTPEGQIYGLFLAAAGVPRASLLWLPPFAEEAHCARRHMLAAARECQARGFASLLIDPLGTGESDGDFVAAGWDTWLGNVALAAAHLRKRVEGPLWLAGVRAGCLLAADAASRVSPAGLLCWQPMFAGRSVLDAFLRLKLASQWISSVDANAGSILADLRDALARGESVDVAGFSLSPALADTLAARSMSWPLESAPKLASIEFRSHQPDAGLPGHTPGFTRQCDNWRALGVRLASRVVAAPPFWSLHEAPLTAGLGVASVDLIEALST